MAQNIDPSSSPLFTHMPRDTLAKILGHATERLLEPRGVLFNQGDAAVEMFYILDGLVKLSTTSRSGTEVVVEIFSRGQSFAEALVFAEQDYPVTATAILKARVLAIPCSVVRSELRQSPELTNAILAATYRHLHGLIQQIERLKGDNSLKRTARFILALGEEESASVALPYRKTTVAALIGIKPETLSRNFRKLEDIGVRVDGDTVSIRDMAALRDLVFGD